MRFAYIENSVCSFVVESATMPTVPAGTWVDVTGQAAGPGFMYKNGSWTEPYVSETRKITRLAFLNRFTDAEAVAIDLASIGTTVQAASIRRYLSKVNAASFIDLARQDTRDGVATLETLGLIAAGRATVILDAPISTTEQPSVLDQE